MLCFCITLYLTDANQANVKISGTH